MIDAMEARSEITDVVGEAIYLIGPAGKDRAFEVPSITLTLLPDFQDENWEDIEFQLDIWTRDLDEAIEIERVVRGLFHRETRAELGDVKMWMQFIGGRTVTGPGENDYYGRSLDFRFTPIRQRYLRTAES